MSAIHQVLLAGGAAGYQIPYSLRFRRSNNAAMTRTAGTPTNAKIATWSFWHKRGALGGEWVWGEQTPGAGTFFTFDSGAPDTIRIWVRGVNITSTPVFRDPSAWYHIVVAIDTTQATAADRLKVYVNNQTVTMSGTVIQNDNLTFNESGKSIKISNGAGWFGTSADYIDGYLAEFNFIDGQALTPSSFGQTDSATGVWVPKKYSGTYGNNGFYLKFSDATTTTTIGNDSSGNGNNWTTSGISVTSGVTFDQMLDTPTLNYAVWSPIDRGDTGLDVTNGNLGYTISNATSGLCRATFAASTGKWYWEMTAGANWTASPQHGISPVTASNTGDATAGNGYGWESAATSRLFANGAAGANYGTQISNGDVLMIAVDFDAGKIWYGRNGTWFGSPAGDPAAGTNQSQTITTGVTYAPMFGRDSSNATTTNFVNFGQRAFAYSPPSGFKALNTANLATPSIKKGSLYMDATLRTGTGATASVSSLSFAPDLVWIKSRSAATDHGLYDAVRGVQKQLESNTTTAETTETTGLTAFNSNGYTVGALAQLNTSAATYVDWAWRETLTAGFDIMTYTGNGVSGRTVAHSLGVTPAMIIVKNRDSATAIWSVAHKSLTAGYNVGLNITNAQFQPGNSAYGGISAFDSSTFTVVTGLTDQRNVNTNGDNYVAYLWSEIEGFSKFGSYTGNASTDGPFVWCGFRPKFVLVKNKDAAVDWVIQDAARSASNPSDPTLYPDLGNAEGTSENVDFLSNGFKPRNTLSRWNANANTFVFAAFAENPFKYARAR